MAPYAKRVREEAGIPVASAWGFDAPDDAERAIAQGQMDVVMIGRAFLANPHYPYVLAQKLGVAKPDWLLPAPYAHWLERYHGVAKG
jgi:2,4-dienoyl-CoA reductase-like NADH-dependent reductase (Old Yellow Enzyme family)